MKGEVLLPDHLPSSESDKEAAELIPALSVYKSQNRVCAKKLPGISASKPSPLPLEIELLSFASSPPTPSFLIQPKPSPSPPSTPSSPFSLSLSRMSRSRVLTWLTGTTMGSCLSSLVPFPSFPSLSLVSPSLPSIIPPPFTPSSYSGIVSGVYIFDEQVRTAAAEAYVLSLPLVLLLSLRAHTTFPSFRLTPIADLSSSFSF